MVRGRVPGEQQEAAPCWLQGGGRGSGLVLPGLTNVRNRTRSSYLFAGWPIPPGQAECAPRREWACRHFACQRLDPAEELVNRGHCLIQVCCCKNASLHKICAVYCIIRSLIEGSGAGGREDRPANASVEFVRQVPSSSEEEEKLK